MDERNPVNGKLPFCTWPACTEADGQCRNESRIPCDRRMVGASPRHVIFEGIAGAGNGEAARPTGRPSSCEAPSAAQGEARSRVKTTRPELFPTQIFEGIGERRAEDQARRKRQRRKNALTAAIIVLVSSTALATCSAVMLFH